MGSCAVPHSVCGKWVCRLLQSSLLLLKYYFRTHSSTHLQTSSCQLPLTLPPLPLILTPPLSLAPSNSQPDFWLLKHHLQEPHQNSGSPGRFHSHHHPHPHDSVRSRAWHAWHQRLGKSEFSKDKASPPSAGSGSGGHWANHPFVSCFCLLLWFSVGGPPLPPHSWVTCVREAHPTPVSLWWVVLCPGSGQSANLGAMIGSEMDTWTSQGNKALLQDFCQKLLKVISPQKCSVYGYFKPLFSHAWNGHLNHKSQ